MRIAAFDGLRGVFLLLMMMAHLQGAIFSQLGKLNHHRVSFADAAHGFVLLSGIVVGMYMARTFFERGPRSIWKFAAKRLRIVYLYHIGTALTLYGIAFLLGGGSDRLAAFNDFDLRSLSRVILLQATPNLLTILPMYLVFISISPLCVQFFAAGKMPLVITASFLVWFAAQFGIPQEVGLWAEENLYYPYAHYAGIFKVVAWQFIYVIGLVIGYTIVVRKEVASRFLKASTASLPAALLAFVLLAALKLYFDVLEISPDFGSQAARWIYHTQSKWVVSPIFLLSIAVNSLIVTGLLGAASTGVGFFAAAGRGLSRVLTNSLLVQLGKNSIKVFSAHIIIVYMFDHYFDPKGVPEPIRYFLLLAGTATLLLIPALLDVVERARATSRQLLSRLSDTG